VARRVSTIILLPYTARRDLDVFCAPDLWTRALHVYGGRWWKWPVYGHSCGISAGTKYRSTISGVCYVCNDTTVWNFTVQNVPFVLQRQECAVEDGLKSSIYRELCPHTVLVSGRSSDICEPYCIQHSPFGPIYRGTDSAVMDIIIPNFEWKCRRLSS